MRGILLGCSTQWPRTVGLFFETSSTCCLGYMIFVFFFSSSCEIHDHGIQSGEDHVAGYQVQPVQPCISTCGSDVLKGFISSSVSELQVDVPAFLLYNTSLESNVLSN